MTTADSASGGGSDEPKDVRYIDDLYQKGMSSGVNSDINAEPIKDKKAVDVGEPTETEKEPKEPKKRFFKRGTSKEKPPMVSLIQLFRFADRLDKAMLIVGTVAACASGVMMPLMTLLFSNLAGKFLSFNYVDESDEAQRHELDTETRRYCWYFLALGLAAWAVATTQKLMWSVSSERMGKRVREAFYVSILRQDVGWFDGLSTGELTTRISGDVNLIQEGVSEKFSFVIQYVSTFISGIVLAFVRGWQLTLVVLAVMPLLAGSAAVMGILLAENTSGGQDAYATAGSVASEVLSSIKTVMAFGTQDREVERFSTQVEKARAAGLRKAWVLGGCMGFIMFCVYGVYALGFWYGGKLAREGTMSPEAVLNAFFALIIGGFALGNAAPSISAVASARGAAVKVYQVIDRVSPIDAVDTERGISAQGIHGEIELKSVDFWYPTRPDVQVLHGLSMHVRAGQRVAVVGESGCGKSTMIGLIERFYDPAAGSVLIDGIDVAEYNVRSLRQQIGVIMQMPVLFGHSIYQNIVWGASGDIEPTKEQVEQACRDANAHDFIMELPDGYDTMCGERGALLSGGQKQRIAIARALVRNPSILLLDEATSALDSSAERVVQEALDRASTGRTTVTVAHRLSTVRDADVIFVVAKGRVLEAGSHDELLTRGGAYAALVEAQQLRQELDQDVTKKLDSSDSSIRTGEINDGDDYADQIKGVEVDAARTHTRGSMQKTIDEPMEEESGEPKKVPKGSHGALFKLVCMERKQAAALVPGALLAMIDGASLPCFSLVFSRMLIAIAIPDSARQKKQVDLYAGLFFMFAGVACVAVGGRSLLFGRAGEKVTCAVRKRVFTAMVRQDAAFFDERTNGTGALTARLATEAGDVNKTVGEAFPAFIAGAASITSGVAIAFSHDWRLTLVILATLPFLTLAFYMEGRSVYETTKAMKRSNETASQEAAETVANVRTVASLTREHTFIAQFRENSAGPYKQALRNHAVGSVGYGFAQATMFLVYCLAFFVGSRFVLAGYLTVEEMFNVMYAIVFSAIALGLMAQQSSALTKGLLAADALLTMMRREPIIDARSTDGATEGPDTGAVTLRDVRFAYPTRARAHVLRGINLDVRAGQTVALVGPSGSGKSTVVALAQRLYDTLAGSVQVNGLDVREWMPSALRADMAIVGQEPVLFDYTIGENIAYGQPTATQSEIENAARAANAHSFIMDLPDGYATRIGQSGAQLSGGQKQRIAIARALVRNPSILLLDEATSALDSRSERVVQDALDAAATGRTTITIAHRLSTVQNADCIVVFKNGRVVESGSHDQLLAMGGLYSLLVAQQSLEVTH
ncbi:hypothetical protein IW139_001768 [Coemansia sp. RSA 353]|nr:hypothetical protein LPJ69_000719 [Coemansia sp. RSA 1752]KAJ2207162.1 hypothetical protein IW145_001655 [Coemansia sp. RSA 521]KAJ2290325.1 hypothetical protein IW141_003339 [Coemansia sp. RSA 355]KAJ2299359.1 hypothetical protein IW139_001768 [Coemansia sp. RSA 353]